MRSSAVRVLTISSKILWYSLVMIFIALGLALGITSLINYLRRLRKTKVAKVVYDCSARYKALGSKKDKFMNLYNKKFCIVNTVYVACQDSALEVCRDDLLSEFLVKNTDRVNRALSGISLHNKKLSEFRRELEKLPSLTDRSEASRYCSDPEMFCEIEKYLCDGWGPADLKDAKLSIKIDVSYPTYGGHKGSYSYTFEWDEIQECANTIGLKLNREQ